VDVLNTPAASSGIHHVLSDEDMVMEFEMAMTQADNWLDAGIADAVMYLYGNKHLALPEHWRRPVRRAVRKLRGLVKAPV
jgi:hypothetical protein